MPETDWIRLLIDAGGLVVMVSIVGLFVMRGWLVPGSTVDRWIDTYDRIIADKNEQIKNLWETNRLESQRGDVLAEGQRQMLTMLQNLTNRG